MTAAEVLAAYNKKDPVVRAIDPKPSIAIMEKGQLWTRHTMVLVGFLCCSLGSFREGMVLNRFVAVDVAETIAFRWITACATHTGRSQVSAALLHSPDIDRAAWPACVGL